MKTFALIFFAALTVVRPTWALSAGDLSRVTFQQHPGHQLSGDLVFRDENNQPFRLGEHFEKQPTILVLGYYRCPMLCTLINDGLIRALQELRLNVGRDFQVIDLSIDPTETADAAAKKKSEYLRRYGRNGAAGSWHCLVGDEHSIARAADEVGYHFVYDAEAQQYAHPSGLVVLTPEGKISRYLFGVNFDPKELRAALLAAKEGDSSSAISQFVLLCYHYNPITGKYGAVTMSILRVVSLGFVAGIVWWIVSMARRPGTSPTSS